MMAAGIKQQQQLGRSIPLALVASRPGADEASAPTQARRQLLADGLAERRLADNRGGCPCASNLVFVQQYAFGLLRIYWTLEQLIVFEEDLDERGARGDCALDQRLGQRVFDVLLQRSA